MHAKDKEALAKEIKEREQEQKRIFLEGLKRYKDRGVPIYIDGKECQPEEFKKLFEVREKGVFYMGDYVETDTGKLQEIHFDKVYNK